MRSNKHAASSGCSNFTYYQSIFNKTKAYGNNASLILNHGVQPAECYTNASDIMVSAEYDWKYYSGNIGAWSRVLCMHASSIA